MVKPCEAHVKPLQFIVIQGKYFKIDLSDLSCIYTRNCLASLTTENKDVSPSLAVSKTTRSDLFHPGLFSISETDSALP